MLEKVLTPGDYWVAESGNIAPGYYYFVSASVANEPAGVNSTETGCRSVDSRTPLHLILKSGCILTVFGSIKIWRDTEGTFGL